MDAMLGPSSPAMDPEEVSLHHVRPADPDVKKNKPRPFGASAASLAGYTKKAYKMLQSQSGIIPPLIQRNPFFIMMVEEEGPRENVPQARRLFNSPNALGGHPRYHKS